MITLLLILGVALIVVGALVAKLSILLTIGIIALIVAGVLILLGMAGHPIGSGRRWR